MNVKCLIIHRSANRVRLMPFFVNFIDDVFIFAAFVEMFVVILDFQNYSAVSVTDSYMLRAVRSKVLLISSPRFPVDCNQLLSLLYSDTFDYTVILFPNSKQC